MFERIMTEQAALQDRMNWPTGKGVAGAKENFLAMQVEVTEVLAELPWKPWKSYADVQRLEAVLNDPVARKRLATEMTDIIQFWANAALALGLTAEDLHVALETKWGENHRRVEAGEAGR
mgnify:CR=1 FL=1